MSAFILDASSLIAMLKGEKGAEKVAVALDFARMRAVNYAEVVSYFVHGGTPERQVDLMLHPLPITLVPADGALARLAGKLRKPTASAGLSLGDRFCLALAQQERLPAWTTDTSWHSVAKLLQVEVMVIR